MRARSHQLLVFIGLIMYPWRCVLCPKSPQMPNSDFVYNLESSVFTVELWNFNTWCIPMIARSHQLLAFIGPIMYRWRWVFIHNEPPVLNQLRDCLQSTDHRFHSRVLKFLYMMYSHESSIVSTFGVRWAHNVPVALCFYTQWIPNSQSIKRLFIIYRPQISQ